MTVYAQEFGLRTAERCQLVDVTAQVRAIVAGSAVRDGLCVVRSPHTTAGIAVNENADPDVARDLLYALERLAAPLRPGFRHGEGNSDSHLKVLLTGTAATLAVRGGRLALGTWQGVFFCEFDGPRERTCCVDVLAGAAG